MPMILKVNGREVEVHSLEQLITLAQKGLAADEKFEKAAQLRKEAIEIITGLK